MSSISTDEREVTLHLSDVHCPGCAGAIERVLRTQPAITRVHFDWANDVVHVGYQAGIITPAAIEQLITTTGCSCAPAGQGAAAAQPPAQQKLQHLAHGVAMQPITMGTKYDRMQYELPATAAHEHPQPPVPATTDSAHTGHAEAARPAEHGPVVGMDHSAHPGQAAPLPMTHGDHAIPAMPAGMDHSAHAGPAAPAPMAH